MKRASFKEVWLVDFEFNQPEGHTPQPLCLVAYELNSQRWVRQWLEGATPPAGPPYGIGKKSLFVAYYASAEMNCHLAQGWPMPVNILDLCAEFKCQTSGIELRYGKSLLGALSYFHHSGLSGNEKEEMRELAMRGGPYTEKEKQALIDYCQSDVEASIKLYPNLQPKTAVKMGQALLRGRYMKASAQMETCGIPIDGSKWRYLRQKRGSIRTRLIRDVDSAYGVFEGDSFSRKRWGMWCRKNKIDWPRLKTGNLCCNRDAFKLMALTHPRVQPMAQLRVALSEMRNSEFCLGPDNRNRCMLSAFASKTGRNQPSTSRFVFGQSKWFRHLIKPEKGKALAYIDYEQQEFAVAAALSNDEVMMEAYRSGDPYLAFAKQTGAVPKRATKQTHPQERELYKECALAVQYGMTAKTMAKRLNRGVEVAQMLIDSHQRLYRAYWCWSERVEDTFIMDRKLESTFGWQLHADRGKSNMRSVRNFPMQANGAEILRLACILMTEHGIKVCAPVHDAVLIEADLDKIEATVREARRHMGEASKTVLNGFEVRTDYKIVRYPNCYQEEKGRLMWEKIQKWLK